MKTKLLNSRFFKAAKIILQILFLLGCCWFILPVLHGGFGLGAAFGLCVCLLGFTLLRFYKRISAMGGWKSVAARTAAVLYAVGMAWAVYLSVLMLSAQFNSPPQGTNVIVLGAQVYSAERMGASLTNRVNAAGEYLIANPESKCIVTGGQGADEPCPEALTAKNALVRMGISADRIFLEDRSHNTRQNLKFAMKIAEENNLGTEFVITTQSFHMYRAIQLAKATDFTAYSLVAETDPIIFPEYFGRELLSLTKWHVQHMILD